MTGSSGDWDHLIPTNATLLPAEEWDIDPGYRSGFLVVVSGVYTVPQKKSHCLARVRHAVVLCEGCDKHYFKSLNNLIYKNAAKSCGCQRGPAVSEKRKKRRKSSIAAGGMKTCGGKCKRHLPVECFAKNKLLVDGLMSKCRECFRDSYLIKKYGITSEQYRQKELDQNECCAGCFRHKSQINLKNGYFCVDHNHGTEAVRDLLCHDCNVGIGSGKEEPTTFRQWAAYIEHHNKTGGIGNVDINAASTC